MESIRTTFRAIVAAGLIVSLGFAGICPCSADGARGSLPRQACDTSHQCTCVVKTGHCDCASACQCGQRLPQKDDEPAVPNRSSDRGQPLGLAADAANVNGAATVAIQALGCPGLSTGNSLSLIAQETRFNC